VGFVAVFGVEAEGFEQFAPFAEGDVLGATFAQRAELRLVGLDPVLGVAVEVFGAHEVVCPRGELRGLQDGGLGLVGGGSAEGGVALDQITDCP